MRKYSSVYRETVPRVPGIHAFDQVQVACDLAAEGNANQTPSCIRAFRAEGFQTESKPACTNASQWLETLPKRFSDNVPLCSREK